MKRTVFQITYIVGTAVVMFTGYPWSQLNFLLLQPTKAEAALDWAFWLALLVPLALIGVASARGATIGRPRLFIFPLAAFCLSATAFGYGWLSRAVASGEPSAAGFLPMPIAMSLGLISAFAPFFMHVACIIVGSTGSVAKLSPAAHG